MTDDILTVKRGDFLCIHDKNGLDRCDAILAYVKKQLNATDADLLSIVVHTLNFDFHAYITCIATDMWSKVTSKEFDGDFTTSIQCDRVEDGVAATWLV